jgi:hypothetical protein
MTLLSSHCYLQLITPFMDEITKKKVLLLKNYQQLKDYIDDENLEEEYGGTNTFKYNYRQYKRELHKLWKFYRKRDCEKIRELKEKNKDLKCEESEEEKNRSSTSLSSSTEDLNQKNASSNHHSKHSKRSNKQQSNTQNQSNQFMSSNNNNKKKQTDSSSCESSGK